MRSYLTRNSLSGQLSGLIMSTPYWYNRSRYSCSICHVSDIQTGHPEHQCCEHFRSICMPMTLFSILACCRRILSSCVLVLLCFYPLIIVVLSIGYGGLAPIHIRLLEMAKLCCVFIFISKFCNQRI